MLMSASGIRRLFLFSIWSALAGSASAQLAITSIIPNNAYKGDQITIAGSGFTGTTNVLINGNSVSYFKVMADNTIHLQVPINYPAGQLSGLVTVQTPGGSATSGTPFGLNTTPFLISAFFARQADGYKLVLDGRALGNATAVYFQGLQSFTAVSDWRILVPVASLPTSNVVATVITPGGPAEFDVDHTRMGLINSIPPGTAGQFDIIRVLDDGSPSPGGSSGTYVGIDGWVRVSGYFLSSFYRFIDIGTGTVRGLHEHDFSAITQPPTLTVANRIVSAGTFVGSAANTIAWTNTTSLDPYSSDLIMSVTFTAQAGTLGTIKLRSYIDADVELSSDDFFATNGAAASDDLLLLLLDSGRRFGFGMDGAYSATPGRLVNATFDGFAAAMYFTLRDQITARTQVYGNTINAGADAAFNVNTTSLTVSNDWEYGVIYVGAVSGSLAWTVDPSATTATITMRLLNRFISGPSMQVLGTNGAFVESSGDPVLAKGTDYGVLPAGAAPVPRTFVITNSGPAVLNITGCTTGGAHAAKFMVGTLPATVAPGTAENLTIAFDSQIVGSFSASIAIANDSVQSPFVMKVQAVAVRATQTINFPAIPDQNVNATVGLAAMASSGLPVSFAVGAGPGTISGGTNLVFSDTGTVSVVAFQSGNAAWEPAPNVTNTFQVTAVADSTLAIEVTPAAGAWQLYEPPAGYEGPRAGTGNLAPIVVPTGIYTVTWGELASYEPPAAQTGSLLAGQTLVFTGAYLEVSDELASPGGVSATDGVYSNFIQVSWQPNALPARAVISYEIRRALTNNPVMAIRLADVAAGPGSRSGRMHYDDYAVEAGVSYYYWVRARMATQISRLSYVGMGYAKSEPVHPDGIADLAVRDLVFLPVNLRPESPAGTVSLRLANLGPDALQSAAVEFGFYMGQSGEMLWIGGARQDVTLPGGAEELLIMSLTARRTVSARGDLPDGPLTTQVRVRHLSGMVDPDLANNTAVAAGKARVRSAGIISRGRGLTDYDGDGKSDLALLRDDRSCFVFLASGDVYSRVHSVATGLDAGTMQPAMGDYDGDGLLDMGLYDESSGMFFVQFSSTAQLWAAQLGGPGFRPVPADYDGDGLTDPALYDQSTGLWIGLRSYDNYTVDYNWIGGPGSQPVPGDYDGDGLADLVVYSPESGVWAGLLSSQNYREETILTFGGPEWQALTGDFDGDGLSDPALYHAGIGQWLVRLSGAGAWDETVGWALGGPGWMPVPGDYDGDGKSDPMVYNPLEGPAGAWRGLLSSIDYSAATGEFGGESYEAVSE